MIERKYHQRQLGEGFIRDHIDDCWEPWMKIADEILDDEELIESVYAALRRRRPQSGTRGRKGTPAEVALRMLALKHMRNWSFDVLEREVRANLVYRMFTRIGAEKVVTEVRAAFHEIFLILTVGDLAHAADQQAIAIILDEAVPIAAPDDFDNVPARASEDGFEFLNDLSVAANRAIEPLQVAVHDEDEIVESFARGQCD